jgi:hypothetical protein
MVVVVVVVAVLYLHDAALHVARLQSGLYERGAHVARTHEQTRRHSRKGECNGHMGAVPNKTQVQYVPASRRYTSATQAWHAALSGTCLSGSACRTKASISE